MEDQINKNRVTTKTVFILLLTIFCAGILFNFNQSLGIKHDFFFHLGLDLQGGAHLVYEGDLSNISNENHEQAMESVREVIERRVNLFGVSEPVVRISGQDRLIVELPGVEDVEKAVQEIGATPFLEFRILNPAFQQSDDNATFDPSERFLPTDLTGKNLQKSDIVFDPQTNIPQITLQFDQEGKQLFAEITKEHIGEQVAIFLDGSPISAPVVQNEITSGQAVITGNFTIDEAKELARRLNAGALPVPIKIIQQQSVGATLGTDSLQKSLISGLIGIIAVGIFMTWYYRFAGLIAVLALVIYTIINLAIYQIIPVTLTLSGIAGFILSVGMAVDANILIFERTKEELKKGYNLQRAVYEGFKRAWTAIRDSNVSSLITVVILAYFGTSVVRGFALTLGIGILVSIFSAIFVTRTIIEILIILNVIKTKKFVDSNASNN